MSRIGDLRKEVKKAQEDNNGKLSDAKLKEAWMLALEEQSKQPNNIWVIRDFSWVIFDCLKRYTDCRSEYRGDINAYVITLAKARQLAISEDESLFYENAGKNLRYVIWQLVEEDTNRSRAHLSKILDELILWPRTSPLLLPGTIRGLHKGLAAEPRAIVKLFDWYGMDQFEPEDYEQREIDGRKISPEADVMAASYLKALAIKNSDGSNAYSESHVRGAIEAAKELLRDPRTSTWQWTQYRLGSLLTSIKAGNEALALLAPMALDRHRESWIWLAIGQAAKENSLENYQTCLFKGLQVSREVKISKLLHENALGYFLENEMLSEAKAEAILLEKCHRENGWKPNKHANSVLLDHKFDEIEPTSYLKAVYKERSNGVEDVIRQYVRTTDFYVEYIDEKNSSIGIGLIDERLMPSQRLKPESIIRKRLHYDIGNGEILAGETYTAILDARQREIIGGIHPEPEAEIRQLTKREGIGILGRVKRDKDKDLAFIRVHESFNRQEDAYVPHRLIEENPIEHGSLVRFKEHLIYKKPKDSAQDNEMSTGRWAWRLSSIEAIEATTDNLSGINAKDFFVEYIDIERRRAKITILGKPMQRLPRLPINARRELLESLWVELLGNPEGVKTYRVFRGWLFGCRNKALLDKYEEATDDELATKVLRENVTGLIEIQNGWGNVGCEEEISVSPDLIKELTIKNGSRVKVNAYKTYKQKRSAEGALPSDTGRWEWRAATIEVIGEPETIEADGELRLATAGYGFVDVNDDETAFVNADIVKAYGLKNGDRINAKCRKSWDRRKSRESWTATDIIEIL